MGGGNPTWINDYFNGELVVFPDDTDWRIGTQISEKYDFLEAERTGLEADLAESQVVCRCHQVAGPDVGRAGIMKIRIQVPTEFPADGNPEVRAREARPILSPYTAHEVNMLTYLNEKGCSATPKLLTWNSFLQDPNMPVPGGCMAFLVMEELPGVSLDNFWDYDRKTRDKIRAAFRPALTEVYSHNAYPSDKRPPNIQYDEENDRCYILDYEDVEFMPPDSTKEWIGSDEFFFWRLAYTRQDDEEVW